MFRKVLKIAVVCLLLSGCYSSGGEIRLFNRYNLFGNGSSSVKVEKGDTLYSISRKYDVPLKDLIEVNSLSAPYSLKIGQTLKLPAARYC